MDEKQDKAVDRKKKKGQELEVTITDMRAKTMQRLGLQQKPEKPKGTISKTVQV